MIKNLLNQIKSKDSVIEIVVLTLINIGLFLLLIFDKITEEKT